MTRRFFHCQEIFFPYIFRNFAQPDDIQPRCAYLVGIDRRFRGGCIVYRKFSTRRNHPKQQNFSLKLIERRFIVRHGILRKILSLYLGIDPQAICFYYATYGKPYLCPQPSADTIQFSVSHSKGLALFAFTKGRRIGIDLEHLQLSPKSMILPNSGSTPKWLNF